MTIDPRRPLLVRVLEAHEPAEPAEAASLAEILAGLRVLARPFDVDVDPRHVTASAIVVDDAGRVLLHLHRRIGVWLQPGGHVDPGEQPRDAVLREVREETGLTPTHLLEPPVPIHVDAHDGGRGHRHYDLRYLVTVPDGRSPAPPEGESQHVEWLHPAEARRRGDRSVRAAIDAAERHLARRLR